MIRRPPRSTLSSSSAASDVYKRQGIFLRIFPGIFLRIFQFDQSVTATWQARRPPRGPRFIKKILIKFGWSGRDSTMGRAHSSRAAQPTGQRCFLTPMGGSFYLKFKQEMGGARRGPAPKGQPPLHATTRSEPGANPNSFWRNFWQPPQIWRPLLNWRS